VTPAHADDPHWRLTGREGPHIRFSPALHAYSKAIVGDETNPYRIAQKLFAAVDASRGAVRASIPRSPTSAITHCAPAMPIAANRPCC
jgi:hypothetical protein